MWPSTFSGDTTDQNCSRYRHPHPNGSGYEQASLWPRRQFKGEQFSGIEILAAPADRHVQVRTGDLTCATAESDGLALFDFVAFLHLELREVHIHGHEAKAVIDDHAVPFVK